MTTKQIFIRIAIIIAVVEMLIMMALGHIPHHAGFFSEAIIDVALLVILSSPMIYIWAIKPFIDARGEALSQLRHMAHIDPLTNLANRRLFLTLLEKALASASRHTDYGALLLIDLDNFKHVNDNYGHEAGDALLIEVAERLQSKVRAEDVVGRLGGDEFVVLIHRLGPDEQMARKRAFRIADSLLKTLDSPFEFGGTTLRCGASIGIRLLGFKGLDADEALRGADIAMYRAKEDGGRSVRTFNCHIPTVGMAGF